MKQAISQINDVESKIRFKICDQVETELSDHLRNQIFFGWSRSRLLSKIMVQLHEKIGRLNK